MATQNRARWRLLASQCFGQALGTVQAPRSGRLFRLDGGDGSISRGPGPRGSSGRHPQLVRPRIRRKPRGADGSVGLGDERHELDDVARPQVADRLAVRWNGEVARVIADQDLLAHGIGEGIAYAGSRGADVRAGVGKVNRARSESAASPAATVGQLSAEATSSLYGRP